MLLCVVMLSAGATFAASDNATLSEVSDEIAVDETVLSVADDSAVIESNDDSILSADEVGNIVTNETFFSYFDDSGVLLDNVSYDELIFEGNFNGLNLSYISINKPITFTGYSAVFEDITFSIDSDNVVVDGFTVLAQSGDNSAFAVCYVSNVTLSNNIVNLNALEGHSSFAVYAKLVDNFNLINNTIFYVGNTDGTVVNNALRIEGDDEKETPSTNIVVSGNTFNVELPSVDVEYDMTTYEPTVYSEGIVFYYVEDVEFVDNIVEVSFNDVVSAWGYDSLYAVSVKGNPYIYEFDDDYSLIYPVVCKNVVIADNNIDLEGRSCAYAVFAGAEGLEITDNEISSSSVTYLAHGIDVDSNTVDAMVADNVIVVEAPLAGYGICADGYMGPVKGSKYVNNSGTVSGYSGIGIKVVVDNSPVISENTVVVEGNYTYGIIANNGVVSGNDVYVLGSNRGSDSTGDSYMTRSSVGISVSGDSFILNNIIESTDIGIKLVQKGEIVVDNNTINVISNTEDIDNHAIVSDGVDDLLISNNQIRYIGATAPKDDYNTAKAYAVYVINTAVEMENNTIEISIPSLPADWEEVPVGSGNYVMHAYTEGIVFDGCDNSSLSSNNITLTYDEGNYGSIYVVDVMDSDNFVIKGNLINATGESYLYGIIMEGENFNIAGNTIYACSESYANGIDIEGTSDGVVESNVVITIAEDTAYPIYGGMTGPVSCNITNNEIYGCAYFVVGIELGGEDVEVNDNNIAVEGNYTIAVGVNVDSLVANNNTIISNASNVGDISVWDSIGTDTTGIKSKKGNVQIHENYILTTGAYTAVIGDSEGAVTYNYLMASECVGDGSVYSTGCATVVNNSNVNSTIDIPEIVLNYGESINVTVTTFGAKNITAKINGRDTPVIGFIIPISGLNATTYALTVTTIPYGGYNSATKTANITVNKADSDLAVSDFAFDYGITGSVNVSFVGASGVRAEVVNQSEAVVSVEGNVISVSGLDVGTYTLSVTTVPDANHNEVTKTASITVNKLKTVLVGDAIVTDYNIGKDAVITLTDGQGRPLSGVNVTVDFNGAKSYVTDEKGQVNVSISGLAPDNYTLKVSYAGSTNYAGSDVAVNVVVNKAVPELTAKKKTFKVQSKTKKYTVILKDNLGRAIENAKVTLKIKGKTYTAKTNGDGKATFKIKKLNKKGKFTAVVTYKGDSFYTNVKVKSTVKVTFKTISKGTNDKAMVKKIQKALKKNGYYIKYKGHYLKVDGKFSDCTQKAVKAFQKAKGIKATGNVDYKTAKKLKII